MRSICRTRRQSGFTLVEIMVAITISLILLAGVIQIFLSNKQTYATQEGMSRLQENVRFALNRMLNDIAGTGYMGCLNSAGSVTDTLKTTGSGYIDFSTAITGTEGAAGAPDQITVRSVFHGDAVPLAAPMIGQSAVLTLDTAAPGYSKLKQGDIVAVSDCASTVVFQITNTPGSSGGVIQHIADFGAAPQNSSTDFQRIFGSENASAAAVYPLDSTTFFVQDSGREYVPGVPVLSLYSQSNNGAAQELVEGIQDLQILYGEDLAPLDGTADRYVAADVVGAWDNVTSVRIQLTVDSVQRSTQNGDGRLQKTVNATVKLRARLI